MSCCCKNPTNRRYNSSGQLEVSYDGGVTWSLAPDADDRYSGAISPPLTGADGSDKRCLGATSAAEFVKQNLIDDLTEGETYANLYAAMVALCAVLGVTGVGILIAAFAAAIFIAGVSAVQSAFTSEVWADFKCILYCASEDDASFTETGWQEVKSQIISTFTGVVSVVLYNWVNSVGLVGLTNAARSGFATSGDCSECECAETWCYEWNFLTDDGDFSATFGTWVLGQGWVGTTAGTGSSIFLQKAMAMTTVTHVEADVVYNPRGNLNIKVGTTSTVTPANVLSGTYTWDGSVTDDDITVNPSSGESQGNSVRLTRMLMRGNGVNPFGTNNCE